MNYIVQTVVETFQQGSEFDIINMEQHLIGAFL